MSWLLNKKATVAGKIHGRACKKKSNCFILNMVYFGEVYRTIKTRPTSLDLNLYA